MEEHDAPTGQPAKPASGTTIAGLAVTLLWLTALVPVVWLAAYGASLAAGQGPTAIFYATFPAVKFSVAAFILLLLAGFQRVMARKVHLAAIGLFVIGYGLVWTLIAVDAGGQFAWLTEHIDMEAGNAVVIQDGAGLPMETGAETAE